MAVPRHRPSRQDVQRRVVVVGPPFCDTMLIMPKPSSPETFWNRVERTATCWLWKGQLDAGGYGHLRFRGRFVKAHALAFELTSGPIPDGLELDHLCKVRNCVNPDHLEPVTHEENCRRAFAGKTACRNGHPYTSETLIIDAQSGARRCRVCRNEQSRLRKWNKRTRHGHPIGVANPCAKLTEDQVRAVRSSTRTAREAAEEFGISKHMVFLIRTRRAWVHVA